MARKVDPVARGWLAMVAGNDISPATAILQKIDAMPKGSPANLSSVSRIVRSAYRAQRREQIEDEILQPMGFTLDSFHALGKQQLTEREHERILEQLRFYELPVEFVVHGFDGDGRREPHIFTIENPGKCSYYDKIGFWAIGSGQHQAVASLFANQYSRWASLEVCVARVLAAKMAAESAVGVGRETWLMIDKREFPPSTLWLDEEVKTEFREEWQLLPKIPMAVLSKIRASIDGELVRVKNEANSSKSLDALAAMLPSTSGKEEPKK